MQKNIMRLLIIVLIILSFFYLLQIENIQSLDITIYVDTQNFNGPWDGTKEYPYNKIQDGIDQLIENGTVYVSDGTYHENIRINKTIKLVGNDKTTTIINGDGKFDCILINANNTTIQGFTCTNCTRGINISRSSNSTITENTILKTEYALYISKQSDNNIIYMNNFLTNTVHAYDQGTNIWNNEYSVGGNYWDTYNGTDTNNDGIGDKPYKIIGGNNQDRYPLIQPITQHPIANFYYLPKHPTTKDLIQLTDISTDQDGYIVSWLWNFGDQNISTMQHPQHKYRDNGVYYITLTITDNYGAKRQKIKQINISNVPPTPYFNYLPENPTDLDFIYFSDKSEDDDGHIVIWYWDFGDGNISNEKNPTHQYAENGTYTIVFTITDDDGANQTTTQNIIILNVEPIALFMYTPDPATTNDTILFTDYSRDTDGSIISWIWELGDGHISEERSFEHRYQNEGTYTVTLTVGDNDGDFHTIQKFVTVFSPSKSEGGIDSIIIYIIYLVLFIMMIGFVIYLKGKYQ
jgi:parallel beta-helix repeat protein